MMKLKRILPLALSLLLLLGSLAGCGGNPQEDASGTDGPTNTYTPPVNEDGQIVITMPKTLLGGKTAEELEAEDKKQRPTVANQAVYSFGGRRDLSLCGNMVLCCGHGCTGGYAGAVSSIMRGFR